METEHFQAPFRVITLGSIQIENNQIENPSAKELTAWLFSKLHVARQLKYRLKLIIQTERFRESNCKHCKAAVVVEKNLVSFLACHRGGLGGKYYYLACKKKLTFYGRFHEKSMFLNLTHCFILTFSQCHLVNFGVEIYL